MKQFRLFGRHNINPSLRGYKRRCKVCEQIFTTRVKSYWCCSKGCWLVLRDNLDNWNNLSSFSEDNQGCEG